MFKTIAEIGIRNTQKLIDTFMGFLGKLLTVKTELKPLQDLEKIDSTNWLSLSDSPHFLVKMKTFRSGWYLLILNLQTTQYQNAKICLLSDDKHENQGEVSFSIHPQYNTICVFHVPGNISHLRFDPMEHEGEFSLKEFTLIKIPGFYAIHRQLARTSNLHSKFENKSYIQTLKIIRKDAVDKKKNFVDILHQFYIKTFLQKNTEKDYQDWIEHIEKPNLFKFCSALPEKLANEPLISILLPTYNSSYRHLRHCIESVKNQTYDNWQLCIVDDASTHRTHIEYLEKIASEDNRIIVSQRTQNGHISETSNDALEIATGKYCLLLDHDDALSPQALKLFAHAIKRNPEALLIYADEDKIDEADYRYMPHFKPDWNPDLLYSQNYIGHPVVLETEHLKRIGGFRIGYEGSQDHDLLLRFTHALNERQIIHLPWILYHWRSTPESTASVAEAKNYTTEKGIKALQDYFCATQNQVKISQGLYPNTYRCKWPVPDIAPLVSLLIPTRDGYEILKKCISSILDKTLYSNYEILIINNQTTCQKTLQLLNELDRDYKNIRILEWNQPFNYSAINNFGVKQSYGEIVGLINNDVEVINPEWLIEMVSLAIRPEIGCVGAKLFYPDNTIQHAGVILGIGGVAGHSHKYFSKDHPGYFSRLHLTQNISAVTGACLIVRKNIYMEVEGLDEINLKVAFNDVDFCLKVLEAGYRNLYTPWAELYHHESKTRGKDNNKDKIMRFNQEVKFMKNKWKELLHKDPAYNINLTLDHENFSIKQ